MFLDEGEQRPGHDPLRSTTLEVLGWLVGARFAPKSCLNTPAKKNHTVTLISTLSVEGCACLCASSQRIARMRKRSIDRENVDGSVETWEPPSFKIVWGPVSEERAVRFGAISGCESILIRPTMTLELEGILQRIRALMPDAMFPREGDDADSLARRLGDCDFLDDIGIPTLSKGWHRKTMHSTQQHNICSTSSCHVE